MRSDGACASPQLSPSPASAQTGPRGWSRSAEASEPCSLGCRHWPAFASCRQWAGRAWVEAGQEGNRGLVKQSPGSPRSVQATRGTLVMGAGPGLVPLSPVFRVSVCSWLSTQHTQAKATQPQTRYLSWQRYLLLARSVFNFQSTQFSCV